MSDVILRLLSRVLESEDHGIDNKGMTAKVLPAFRLLVVFLCILLTALSRNAVFTLVLLAVSLMRLAFLPPRRIAKVLRELAAPVLFTVLVMLPSLFLGSPGTLLTLTMKVTSSLLLILLMNQSMDWRDITGTFRALHIPGVFTATLDMTMRFLVILGRYAQEMLEAIGLRTVGDAKGRHKDRGRYMTAGGVLGTTFLVSQRLASETWEAMECRGFDGVYRSFGRHRFCAQDACHLLLVPALVCLFWYFQQAV